MKTNYTAGDIKYYRKLHVLRMQATWELPVTYPQFYRRLRNGIVLYDAIYTPRAESKVRTRKETPIQDSIRRNAELKQNWIPLVDMKTGNPSLLNRFISLFR